MSCGKEYGVKDFSDVHMQFPEVDLLEAIEKTKRVVERGVDV